MGDFNSKIKQVLLLMIILSLVYMIIGELGIFIPGLLGAITLYILSRSNYFQLVYNRKWKKGSAAFLFIVFYLFLLGLPVYLAVTLISPKIELFLSNPGQVVSTVKSSVTIIQKRTGVNMFSQQSLSDLLNRAAALLP